MEMWNIFVIFITIGIIATILIRFIAYLKKRRRKKIKSEIIHSKVQYKSEIMQDYGVERPKINKKKKQLICPKCNVYADENNKCLTCGMYL